MSKNKLNVYGDNIVKTTGLHGADIASQRMDELDLKAIRFAASDELPSSVAIDLGCGLGIQGMRFSMLGIETHLYDIMDIAERVDTFKQLLDLTNLEFHLTDLRNNPGNQLPTGIGLVYSQRFIHYLRYQEAQQLLKLLFDCIVPGGKLFFSASGLCSELGDGYACAGQSVENRFGLLDENMQEKHQIHEEVCLYDEKDLHELMLSIGFDKVRLWSSTFGNVKGIFIKTQ